jgi:hypothetical protein
MKLLTRISFRDAGLQLRYDIFRSRVGIAWIRVQLMWNRFRQFLFS